MVLGLLTAIQVGIGVWRAIVMFRGGLAAGVRPLEWSAGLGVDLLTCGLLAAVAWWWIPLDARRSPLPRAGSAAAWGVRFLLCSWLLTLAHYVWGLTSGGLTPWLTWVTIAA